MTLADVCRALRQGDSIATSSVRVGTEDVETPYGSILLSQTCDAVRIGESHPNISVAIAATLDEATAASVRSGRQPRWVPVPNTQPPLFADLEYVASLPKTDLTDSMVRANIPDNAWDDQRNFAQRVGRRFSRMAMPDPIVPWFDGVRELAQGKSGKLESAVGRMLETIVQFRVRAKFWTPPIDLTLYVIVEPGELPLPDDSPFRPLAPSFMSALGEEPTVSQVAEVLFPADGARPHGADRSALWLEFSRALERLVKPHRRHAADAEISNGIRNLTVDVLGEDEFSLNQWRHSDELDFSHLSPPLPVAEILDS